MERVCPCVSRYGLILLVTNSRWSCVHRTCTHQKWSIQGELLEAEPKTSSYQWEVDMAGNQIGLISLRCYGKKIYKGNSCTVFQLNNSTAKCFIHLPLLFGGRRTSPEAPAIILLVAFQWQYSQLPEALINKMKIHTAKLELTTINNIFLFAGQVNSFCK